MKFAAIRRSVPKWQNALLSLVSAALLILAFPPFELWFAAWFALVPLLWAIDREKESIARCFVLGWLFGNVFFFGTCWWLTFAPITYAGFPAPLAYFLLFCVTSVAGIFPGLFAAITSFLLRRFGSIAFLAVPFVWVFTEFLRYWLTGNNWNALGYSQAFSRMAKAFAGSGGVTLVGFICMVVSTSLFLAIRWRGRRQVLASIFLSMFALYLIFTLAFSDFGNIFDDRNTVSGNKIVALQPNVPMSGLTLESWRQLRQRHLNLAQKALNGGIDGYSPTYYLSLKQQRPSELRLLLDEIDTFSEKFRIGTLRKHAVVENDKEIRIWIGFSPSMTRGLLLSDNSASLLPPIGESEGGKDHRIQNLVPRDSWTALWKDAAIADLLSLPDEPTAEWIEPRDDSDAVIVEIKTGDNYRTMMYSSPCNSRAANARKLTAAISAIGAKLGTDFYKCADNSQRYATSPASIVVVFPESPMNFMYEDDPETQEFINGFAKKNNVSVLFNSAEPDKSNGKFFNSAVMVGPEGKEMAQYDKIYLLPFGEAVPFPLDAIMPGFVGNFSYGREYDLLPLGNAKAGVMICFESHFGQLSREYVRNGADAIIEMTNDGYLGPTPVLRQHLANAVFRAVETNRPVLRVTNVGITAYINERGEVLDAAEPYTEATRVWSVAMSDGSQTFYVKYGDWFAWLCTGVSLVLLVFGLIRGKTGRCVSQN